MNSSNKSLLHKETNDINELENDEFLESVDPPETSVNKSDDNLIKNKKKSSIIKG